jgi:signal peptidase II
MSGIIIVDQVSKFYIQQTLELHQSFVIIDGFFNLTYIRNPGAAFGILADHGNGIRTLFLTGVGFLAVLLLAFYFNRSPEEAWVSHLSFALILGGAFGNLLDRIRLGEVVDFLDFYLGKFHWPAFNVADSSISVGLTLLVIFSFTKRGGK